MCALVESRASVIAKRTRRALHASMTPVVGRGRVRGRVEARHPSAVIPCKVKPGLPERTHRSTVIPSGVRPGGPGRTPSRKLQFETAQAAKSLFPCRFPRLNSFIYRILPISLLLRGFCPNFLSKLLKTRNRVRGGCRVIAAEPAAGFYAGGAA